MQAVAAAEEKQDKPQLWCLGAEPESLPPAGSGKQLMAGSNATFSYRCLTISWSR